MAETAAAANVGLEVVLKANHSTAGMHQSLHHTCPSPKHTIINQNLLFEDNRSSSDEQALSASSTDLSAVAAARGCFNNNNGSPTNFSATLLRCERCDNFETSSRATLLLHVVQCLSSPVKLKSEDMDAENLTTGNHMDQTQNNGVAGKMVQESVTNASIGGSSVSPNNGASSRKVFECDVCNMKFSNGANMRRHKMRHTGVKPYECRVCQKRFFRKDHLAEHFTTHTKTLPYHCPICNRGFQRQIAMRAHFQNEHVGHHDMVKTCPLCSYRAGSMKSLRIHFYNRHGIDLDNPGPGGSSSLLLALESQASQAAAAAAAAGFVPNLSAAAVAAAAAAAASGGTSVVALPNQQQSDSGESLRSTENITPPMHFLTPHVEISMTENPGELFNSNVVAVSEAVESPFKEKDTSTPPPTAHVNNLRKSPAVTQEQPLDCITKSSSPSNAVSALRVTASPKNSHFDNHLMPSISLIPIKQEPMSEDISSDNNKSVSKNSSIMEPTNVETDNDFDSQENSKLSSLIKVSPLKSLLREDLKRRICAKANNRITRNSAVHENNNVIQRTPTPNMSASCNSTAICNGTITSSGQETDSTLLNRKQILTCLFCGIEFPDETLYFLHKGCHCESNPWKCNICGEQLNNVYEFNSHLLSKSHQ